jgi:hypothetical protein
MELEMKEFKKKNSERIIRIQEIKSEKTDLERRI